MHELPITQSLLEIVLRHAERAGASRITGIDLALGVFTNYVSDSIQFYFDIISRGTPAEGAILHIHRIPATCRCWDCGQNFVWEETILPIECPHCKGTTPQFTSGDEFYLESMEVEEA